MQYILTDIEGTTTSIDFVYNELFPYFIEHVRDFAVMHQGDDDLTRNLAAVQKTVQEEENKILSEEQTIEHLIQWTKADRKHTALKNIQGMVWKLGYEQGYLKSHVYDDVPPAFAAWREAGIAIGIYSSGSVAAQKLIFRYSTAGDLSGYISGYFDTLVGNKREPASYFNVQQQLKTPPQEILFLSDTAAELDAAAAAGFATLQVVRTGAGAGDRHNYVNDFSAVIFNNY